MDIKNSIARSGATLGPDPAATGADKAKGKSESELHAAAKDFEAIFMQMVLKSMRDTVERSGFIDGGNAEKIYESMLDEHYAKALTDQTGLGLADAIVRQLGENSQKSGDGAEMGAEQLIGKGRALKAYQSLPLQDAAKKVKI